MEGWRACEDWVTDDGRPNLGFLSAHFGVSKVTVADCSRREFTDQNRTEMSVSEFMDYCKNTNLNEDSQPLLYLKDWHFVKEHPAYVAYETPSFFRDDWLNIYLDSYNMHQGSKMQRDQNEINCSDYRFVYMGPKGTWTPLHADVFRSYSWSANVCGKKHWYLLPPFQSRLLFDRNQRNTVYNIFDEVCENQFPGFPQTVWWECVQEKGDIIFVPSGWFHQVHNLEDTISINHNWFNGHNLDFVWNLLLSDYCEAKNYIEDIRDICDDFEWLCQRNLAANTGMNFYDFFIFIVRWTVASWVLLRQLKREESSLFSSLTKVVQHLVSNLIAVYNVAKAMESVEAFTEDNLPRYSGEDWSLLCDVDRTLGEDEFQEFARAIMESDGLNDELKEQDLELNSESFLSDGYFSACFSPSVLQKLDPLCSSRVSLCSPGDLLRLIEHFFLGPDGVCSGLDLSLFPDIPFKS
ncbi:unnamed protein product [Spirodela intermedia]|uniref:JmjC domain-containing protein n=1 Tax=Spirodela intermedia TaxID=51605 RepID=A0A7I8JTK5_SPIIN|nr:unnamed protein product [Spirodela intermedia]CAA6673091.1 unnamed protein product [Spirodela intermedia]